MKTVRFFVFLTFFCLILGVGLIVLNVLNVIDFPFSGWIPWIMMALASFFFYRAERAEAKIVGQLGLLAQFAAADGKVTDEETRIIMMHAQRNGISQKKLRKELEKIAKDGEVRFAVPESTDEIRESMEGLLDMMMADGEVSKEEKALLEEVAKKYDLKEGFVDEAIKRRGK